MKKNFYLSMILITLFAVFFFSCTMAGAELGLMGYWTGDYYITSGTEIWDGEVALTFMRDDSGYFDDNYDYYNGSTWDYWEWDYDNFAVIDSNSCSKTIQFDFDELSDLNGTYTYELTSSKLVIKDFGKYGDLELYKF